MTIPDLSLDDWAAVSQVALAIAALLALLVALIQIVTAQSATRQTLTYNYTHRFSSPELLSYHQKTSELFAPSDDSADERYRHFLELGRAEQLAALVIPNLLEEFGGDVQPRAPRQEDRPRLLRRHRSKAVGRRLVADRALA